MLYMFVAICMNPNIDMCGEGFYVEPNMTMERCQAEAKDTLNFKNLCLKQDGQPIKIGLTPHNINPAAQLIVTPDGSVTASNFTIPDVSRENLFRQYPDTK